MKTRNKRLSIATLITGLVGGTIGAVSASSAAAKNIISPNTTSNTQSDYVEQDDLTNLPSDQDLGIMSAVSLGTG